MNELSRELAMISIAITCGVKTYISEKCTQIPYT